MVFIHWRTFAQTGPVVALAPLLNIWFGHGVAGVSASAAIVAIFPMIANTVDGLRGGDPKLKELFAVYGCLAMATLAIFRLSRGIAEYFYRA